MLKSISDKEQNKGMQALIPFSKPFHADGELQCIQEALASDHLAGDGAFTKEASQRLSLLLDGAHVLLCTSGTHALELAGLIQGLGENDEVVMPSFTFSSTANAFALRGAKIRFADCDEGTFSMEVEHVKAALTPNTTAVVAMPYGGVIRDMGAIKALCEERGLKFVEDNAHGLFARSQGRPMGTFAPLAALSFHQTKNISCGEGGALIINASEHQLNAEILREKGTDRSRFLRGEVDKYTWKAVGSSYLPSEVLAALLVSQLRTHNTIQAARHRVWEIYRAKLEPLAAELGIALQEIPNTCQHPAHLFGFLVGDSRRRGDVLSALKAAGVKATSHYEPLHQAPACQDKGRMLPNTDKVAGQIVRLPLFASLSERDAELSAQKTLDTLRC